MTRSLRVLLIEDSETDAKLVLRELGRHYDEVISLRVETEDATRAALAERAWDVILSDYSLPSFGATRALSIVNELGLDTPFIIVSGMMGEEPAVSAMRSGAHDYVLKSNLARLSPAVDREVREGELRRELLKRRREDERFFNLSLDLLCITGFDGYFKRVNPAWEALLGWSDQELLSMPWMDLVHPEDRASTIDASRQIAEGRELVAFENRVRCKDGSYRSLLWTAAPFERERAVYAAARDISGRKHLEEQLRQSQKMEAIGSLAGSVAHDFNNLLTVILSYSSLVLAELRRGDLLRDHVQEIEKAGRRASELTRQLLAFSRRQVLEPRVIDLGEVVSGMEKMLRRLLREDIELTIQRAQPLGKVLADPGQMEQVLMNLVVNSLDAMPAGGKLEIEVGEAQVEATSSAHQGAPAGAYVTLAVTDTGIGMDAATLSRVFEPFFTTKAKGKGTGLGLSTVFGVVQQSGGHVAVQSEVGQGTTVRIFLPRTERVDVPPTSRAAMAQTLRGTETVLLVEDDQQVRALARMILRQNGYTVLEAKTAPEAVVLAERYAGTIQLLLTDVVMPQMSGQKLAERILALRPTVRVLYMSGYSDESLHYQGVAESGAALLEKPVTPESLLRKVRAVLSRKDP